MPMLDAVYIKMVKNLIQVKNPRPMRWMQQKVRLFNAAKMQRIQK